MATVRIFAYSELLSASIRPTANRPVTDGLFLLKEPYLANETLSPSTGSAATSSLNTSPSGTKLLKIQVNPGERVHYEVTPQNQDLRIATASSPIISNDEIFKFDEGYKISFLEVS